MTKTKVTPHKTKFDNSMPQIMCWTRLQKRKITTKHILGVNPKSWSSGTRWTSSMSPPGSCFSIRSVEKTYFWQNKEFGVSKRWRQRIILSTSKYFSSSLKCDTRHCHCQFHRHCQFHDVAGAKWHVLGQRERRNTRFESSTAHSRTSRGENHHYHDYTIKPWCSQIR